jgi:hypothetical protein
MLRIAICDDLPDQLTKIKTAVEYFFRAYQDENIERATIL